MSGNGWGKMHLEVRVEEPSPVLSAFHCSGGIAAVVLETGLTHQLTAARRQSLSHRCFAKSSTHGLGE